MVRTQPKKQAKRKKPEDNIFEQSAQGWIMIGRGTKAGLKMIKKAWNGRKK
jgi:hypothetical protein